jgi:hypothetical protein
MERVIYHEAEFDDLGFRRPGIKSSEVLWGDVLRVAYGYELDELALVDWNFWGFQTGNPELLLEVVISTVSTLRFRDEIARRFGVHDIPPVKDWVDIKFPIKTYVIHPEADVGKALYAVRKKHWYSMKGHLYFAQT